MKTTLILKHLRRAGSITNREAMVEYSVGSLTKEIHRLRTRGHRSPPSTNVTPSLASATLATCWNARRST